MTVDGPAQLDVAAGELSRAGDPARTASSHASA
jgi:hypothetical protein